MGDVAELPPHLPEIGTKEVRYIWDGECSDRPSRTQLSSVFPEMHRLPRGEHCDIDKARHAGFPKRKLLLFQQAEGGEPCPDTGSSIYFVALAACV